jgi:hypothetical protein
MYNLIEVISNEPNKNCDNLLTSISFLQDFKFKFSRKINVTVLLNTLNQIYFLLNTFNNIYARWVMWKSLTFKNIFFIKSKSSFSLQQQNFCICKWYRFIQLSESEWNKYVNYSYKWMKISVPNVQETKSSFDNLYGVTTQWHSLH